jgi:hypothetical protein
MVERLIRGPAEPTALRSADAWRVDRRTTWERRLDPRLQRRRFSSPHAETKDHVMTTKQRNVTHSTFTIERTFDHPPARVWAGFATRDAKATWFSGAEDGWVTETWDLGFRIGGKETSISRPKDGPRIALWRRHTDVGRTHVTRPV